ncbi:MAG: arginine--tRNA ligase [Nanoarchaeota archaeon]|nr:arginine--tRNA ligase [Nanoarchaeota archaeon]
MKEEVIKILHKALKEMDVNLKKQEIEKFIEIPPSTEIGDYAFPCFFLAEKLKQDPKQIALQIREKITQIQVNFEDIQTSGPYVNFFVNRKDLARQIVWDAITKKENFGKGKIGKGKKIVVEFSSPNIAKPFGVGHLRSTIIGNSISNICEFQGFKTKKINYFGDWGTQFGKLAYGYQKFGKESELKKDAIKHLLKIYVQISKNKKYEEHSRETFKKMEQGDKKSLLLWKNFRELSIEQFEKIYKQLGIEFDVYEGESKYNKQLPKIVQELEKKKLLKKSKGALIVDLEKYGLGVCIIQKSDGTSIYATRDIAAAISRHKNYKFSRMIYEVGQEQKLHFKQVFKVLELMNYKWAKDCVHVYHGLYLGKSGKKLSTRKGESFSMEKILKQTQNLASKEIKKRFPNLSNIENQKRAEKIAIASIFYGDLKNNRTKDIVFDLDRFVSFDGNTGPYILYSYARASSIIKKSKQPGHFEINSLEPKEFELAKKLSAFPEITSKAYEQMNPSLIANYSYELAQLFNEFYQKHPVLNSESESFRLALVEAFRQIIRNSMNLLGIEMLEEM